MPRAWAWATASAASATSVAARLGVVLVPVQQRHQAAAGDELHREVVLAVVLADLVDRDDAGVVEQRHGLGLVLEPPQLVVAGEQAGLDHLQRHRAVEADLAGLVDDAHAAAAQLAADLVVAEVAHRCAASQVVAVAFGAAAAEGGRGRRIAGRSGVVGSSGPGRSARAASAGVVLDRGRLRRVVAGA